MIQSTTNLILSLKPRGEKLLSENLSSGEEIIAKLPGSFGQALVITNQHIYVIKWGYMAGQMFGGKCIAYNYHNITALEIKKHALTNIVQVLTPATQDNQKLSYWGSSNGQNDAVKSDNAITFAGGKEKALFQEAVNLGRQFISNTHQGKHAPAAQDSAYDQLEKLAELKAKGVITESEFQAKKKQLLDL